MKRKNCPHDRLYRERGPRIVAMEVRDYSGPEDYRKVIVRGPVVIEVCERCWRRQEIGFGFLEEGGKGR